MTHALIRTSPKGKGQEFFGTCIKCGETNLPFEAACIPCPKDEVVSDQEALIKLVKE